MTHNQYSFFKTKLTFLHASLTIGLSIGCLFHVSTGIAAGDESKTTTTAEETNSKLADALSYYEKGEFENAQRLYLELVNSQFEGSGFLYYNLGNSFYRTGKFSWALAAYYKTLESSPRDEDTLENIKLVESSQKDLIQKKQNLSEFLTLPINIFSAAEWNWMSAVSATISAVVFACVTFFKKTNLVDRYIRKTLPLFTPISIFLFGVAFFRNIYQANVITGFVIPEEIVVKSDSSSTSIALFKLSSLTPLAIKKWNGNWAEVHLADGRRGWVSKEDIAYFL